MNTIPEIIEYLEQDYTMIDTDISRVINALKAIELPSDTCSECGTTEFLCGHNKRD